MVSKPVQEALNKQVQMEAESSQAYLAMASWAEIQPGLEGVTEFFYKQSDEERVHELKLIRFINERGGFAAVPALPQPMITFQSLRRVFEEFLKHENSWPSWAFSNHDVVRAASRWQPGGDGFDHDQRLSKLLIALLGCLYGTVFMYQGEELGLPEAKLKREDLRDPWGIHLYPKWQGRDGCRTPIPWDADSFTQPSWLPYAETHKPLDIETQESIEDSTLNFTRRFLNKRKLLPALRDGEIKFMDTGDDKLLAFTRSNENDNILCVFNLSTDHKEFVGKAFEPYGVYMGRL